MDPGQKVSHRIWSWSQKRLEVELAKCQVLCIDCHLKKTLDERPRSPHGSVRRYYTCRCEQCVEAMRQKNARRKERGYI